MMISLENLFIFEIANNHQGRLSHGIKIIDALAAVASRHKIRAAIKFQFRDLDSFVISRHLEMGNKYAERFLSTRLTVEEFSQLQHAARDLGFLTMCTPFDEPSLALVEEMNFDVIKIASCSGTDIPLLAKVKKSSKPVIASTAGMSLEEIQGLASLFQSEERKFALMHCTALYPTEKSQLRLDRISWLRAHFPRCVIGFSSHERSDNLSAVQMAYAHGARVFEKHVGDVAEGITLNVYSASPAQIDRWLESWKEARDSCEMNSHGESFALESRELRKLKRGYVTKREIGAGAFLRPQDLSLSLALFPETQLLADQPLDGLVANREYEAGEILFGAELKPSGMSRVQDFLPAVWDLIESANLPTTNKLELSHHLGLSRFPQVGATILVDDKNPLKKIIILLPGQHHPSHCHESRSEIFRVLYGEMNLEVDGAFYRLRAGETHEVAEKSWHRFWTNSGVVVEEIATSERADSIYADHSIQRQSRSERKTYVNLEIDA